MRELRKILLVDDDPDIQYVAVLALEARGGLVVKTAVSGKEALVEAAKFMPDMILLDVTIPGMDGPSILKELRRMPGFETVPVVFISARILSHEVEQYRTLGALDVILKPFKAMEFPDKLKSIWADFQNHQA